MSGWIIGIPVTQLILETSLGNEFRQQVCARASVCHVARMLWPLQPVSHVSARHLAVLTPSLVVAANPHPPRNRALHCPHCPRCATLGWCPSTMCPLLSTHSSSIPTGSPPTPSASHSRDPPLVRLCLRLYSCVQVYHVVRGCSLFGVFVVHLFMYHPDQRCNKGFPFHADVTAMDAANTKRSSTTVASTVITVMGSSETGQTVEIVMKMKKHDFLMLSQYSLRIQVRVAAVEIDGQCVARLSGPERINLLP
jgi:hypothetical protein